ncbi:MAG: BON domain-containing protein [Betaproteobacteria bacterium]
MDIGNKVSFDADHASTVLTAAADALHDTGWITTNPARDEAITNTIRSSLRKDPDLGVLDVNVETREGVVWLNGSTYDSAARERAERIAKSSRGVTKVLNRLIIREV